MSETNLQKELFNQIKNALPNHVSMVDTLADLLGLSYDSVYRRIRGEKPITLDELKLLCEKFHVSADQLIRQNTESVLFDAPGMNNHKATFKHHMLGMLQQARYFNSFEKKEMCYLCKDAPIWSFYLFPEIAAFKTFFWSKTINNEADLNDKIFSFEEFPYTDCFDIGQQILREFNTIPCIELWNVESMHSTLNQVVYYRDAGNFKSNKDLEMVLDSFLKMINHLQLQAEKGVKFMPGDTEVSYKAPIQFYVNELILGNNTMVMNLNGTPLTMVTYSVFHYLFTKDNRFYVKVMDSFNTLLSRSALISKTGEKERNRFFNALREKINGLRK